MVECTTAKETALVQILCHCRSTHTSRRRSRALGLHHLASPRCRPFCRLPDRRSGRRCYRRTFRCDTKGAAVTDAQVLKKPALVYFGYASCPDVCPLDNARNAAATDLLGKQGMDVTPVFISVDPTRDTPAVLADYVSNFSDKMVALTGSEVQVAAAAKAYKVYYQVPEKRDPGYTVDHTTMTYLMLPGTGFADFFQRDATAEQIADRTACFLKAS
jgi:protein SCO1/2